MDDRTSALAVAIGARVKRERQTRGWTLDRLAEAAGVSRRMLVAVEQGATNPSVGTLLRLGEALGTGLPALVEPVEQKLAQVTRRGEGAVLWQGEAGGRGLLVAGTSLPEVFELWSWTLGPGERHTSEPHPSATRELIEVHTGTLVVEVDGHPNRLARGDAISFPGDVAHAYVNPTMRPVRFSLAVLEPTSRTRAGSAGRQEGSHA